MSLKNYKIVFYRQEDGSWVAEMPAYALMPSRKQALGKFNDVFQMIFEVFREKGLRLHTCRPMEFS